MPLLVKLPPELLTAPDSAAAPPPKTGGFSSLCLRCLGAAAAGAGALACFGCAWLAIAFLSRL
jgi:hypothetical protein